MEKVKILSADLEWVKEMAKANDLDDYEVLEVIIDYWKCQRGDGAMGFVNI